MLTSEDFRKQLRSALNHLYDPDYLRHSPLSSAFEVAGRFDTPMLLQRVLTDAIEALKPGPEVPEAAQAWRTYDILLSRYKQQLSQEQVASQLGVSSRQLAREQAVAVEILALTLWEQFQLKEEDLLSRLAAPSPVPDPVSAGDEPLLSGESISDDLGWVQTAQKYPRANVKEAINTVVDLVSPLANRYAVNLQVTLGNPLPVLSVHPVALRQVLLSLVNIAIHQAGNGSVQLQARQQEREVEIEIVVSPLQSAPGDADQASLDMAQKLVSLSKGRLQTMWNGATFHMKVVLPIFQPVVVLVVDDNQDILDLFQRYTHGTRFHLISTRDSRRAVAMAEKYHPQVIMLDLMMPEIDGWQMLGLLRRHPSTAHIPIMFCSIVSQEELAYSLGAKGFLRKPVTRENLLDALERLLESEEKAPR
jgi:CheY-like chemotaxis protein